jgi:hypothetical protein
MAKRLSPELMVAKLRQIEALVAQGSPPRWPAKRPGLVTSRPDQNTGQANDIKCLMFVQRASRDFASPSTRSGFTGVLSMLHEDGAGRLP